ncbi:MAG TPA: hypothetical protein VFW94_19425 [Candidatus Acidoferrales bacterium]|nr:hypothetical protein [Candidatus Acidoferrales bacterium]
MILSGGAIWLLQPLWRQYALAKPNARSSHETPTPQGGGIAVMLAVLVVAVLSTVPAWPSLYSMLSAALLLAVLGAIDDIRALSAPLRLIVQAVAVILVVATLPSELRVVPIFPWWLERALLVIAFLWFVNLVNFMDGIDWMTVAEVVPVTIALSVFGLTGALPRDATFIAFALCGAMIGFAPFNRPVARLFLGDVGSLPVGLLLGWLLTLLAGNGHFTATLLLPLYYLADATVTLVRRLLNREDVLQAHRSHFYQQAMDGGLNIYGIVGSVFAVNIALSGLAAITVFSPSRSFNTLMLVIGCILVGSLLIKFNRIGRHTSS